MRSDDPRSITCVKYEIPRKDFAKGSFRWVKRGEGVRVLIGCPKGAWDARSERCRVGTRAHKVYRFMTGKKRCPTGYRKYR